MGLPNKITNLNEMAGIDTFYNGGKGSGNFGHSGRKGEIGGSAPSGGGLPRSHDPMSKELDLEMLSDTINDMENTDRAIKDAAQEALDNLDANGEVSVPKDVAIEMLVSGFQNISKSRSGSDLAIDTDEMLKIAKAYQSDIDTVKQMQSEIVKAIRTDMAGLTEILWRNDEDR